MKKNQNLSWSRDLGVLNCTSKYLCFRSSTHPYVLPTCGKYNSTEHLVYNPKKRKVRTKDYSSKAGHVPTSHRTNQIRQSGNEEAQQTRERWIDHWKQRRWISGISGGEKEWILKGDFFLKQKSSFTHFLRYKRRINEDFCERDFFPFLWWPVWMSGNLQWFKLFALLVAVVFGPRPQIVITYRADSGPGVVLLIFLFFLKKKSDKVFRKMT